MSILRGIAMAFSTFSKIPMPKVAWEDRNMRFMLSALPLVGVAIGLLLWGWTALCGALGFSGVLYAAGLTVLPILTNGGIHMDGFCDTIDALSSHAAPERKLEILKDPHPGAFAVVLTGVYLISYFALCTELPINAQTALTVGFIHVTSRALGGIAALLFPLTGGTGMLAVARGSAQKKPALVLLMICFAAAAAALVWINIAAGVVMTAAALTCAGYVRIMCVRQFGGMRGDLIGYLIELTEIAMLAGFILIRGVQSL